MSKEINLTVSDEAYGAILTLMRDTRCTSIGEVIRNSLKTYKWMQDEQKGGRKIQSVPENGAGVTKELVDL